MADGHTFQAPERPDYLALAQDIALAPFIAAEQVREATRAAYAAHEIARSSGVRHSGLSADAHRAATPEQIIATAVAARARKEAWERSPEGRFHRAACLIARATGDERLLNCATRGVAGEIALAERLLATMEGPAADDARAALADLLAAA